MRSQGLSALVAGAMLAMASPAMAAPARPAFVPVGDVADAPSGFTAMCRADARACGVTDAPGGFAPAERGSALSPYFTSAAIVEHDRSGGALPATPASGVDYDRDEAALDGVVRQVNDRVNRGTLQRSDLKVFGVDEFWRAAGSGPGAAGDCEDIALQKRAELLAAGVPVERLMLATVFRSGVGLHTVLVVRRQTGDVVLDSRTDRILGWVEARYSWLRLQSPGNPLEWRRVVRL